MLKSKNFNVYTHNIALYNLIDRLERNQINFLDAQKWDDKKQSILIESILLNIPLTSIVVRAETDGKYTVVKGAQMLYAIKNYISNNLALQDLECLGVLNTTKFNDLTRHDVRQIKETVINLLVISTASGDLEANDLVKRYRGE
jgi:hypothetical protein